MNLKWHAAAALLSPDDPSHWEPASSKNGKTVVFVRFPDGRAIEQAKDVYTREAHLGLALADATNPDLARWLALSLNATLEAALAGSDAQIAPRPGGQLTAPVGYRGNPGTFEQGWVLTRPNTWTAPSHMGANTPGVMMAGWFPIRGGVIERDNLLIATCEKEGKDVARALAARLQSLLA